MKNRSTPSILDPNPWISTLQQEDGKCKVRGNFASPYSVQCPNNMNYTRFLDESFSVHLMKAITSMIYGLRSITADQHPGVLFDPSTIALRYHKMLEVEIPSTLEGKLRNRQPFTPVMSDSSTYGNGKVGYSIFNIIDINGRVEYNKVLTTGSAFRERLNRFSSIPQFPKSDGGSGSYFQSTKSGCRMTAPPTTTSTEAATLTSVSETEIVLGVLIGLIILALIIGLGIYFGRSK